MSNKNKVALITGAAGQDGSYLSDYLLSLDYDVVAMVRRSTRGDFGDNNRHLKDHPQYHIEHGDVTDMTSIISIIRKYKDIGMPIKEFYNLAAQSQVHRSWEEPQSTWETNATGVQNCLEAVRLEDPSIRFYQASTSERFGDVLCSVQNEKTECRPRSPYGAAKVAAEGLVKVYRESYGLFACYGILMNHESPRRGEEFVTRKITKYVARVFAEISKEREKYLCSLSDQVEKDEFTSKPDVEQVALILPNIEIEPLGLGNLDAKRDWSHAADMVRGMHMMLQLHSPNQKPCDYVLASGKTRSIREFLDAAFAVIGVTDWSRFVVVDPKFYRPADVNLLCGDASKAKAELGWEPEISFDQLVQEMVMTDIKRLMKT